MQYNTIGMVNVDRYVTKLSLLEFHPSYQAFLAAVDTNWLQLEKVHRSDFESESTYAWH